MAKLFLCNFYSSAGFKILFTLGEPQTKRVRELVLKFFFWSNATTCPRGLRGPPSWTWQECN